MDRLRNHRNYHSPHSLSEFVNTASQITECIVGNGEIAKPAGEELAKGTLAGHTTGTRRAAS
jgi:hypothetical protein